MRSIRSRRRASAPMASKTGHAAAGFGTLLRSRAGSTLSSAALALAAAGLLAACTLGPDYVRPTAAAAPTWKELEGTGWKPAQPADTQLRGAWWEVYQDPALNALEQQVAQSNQDVKAAEARFRSARATVAQFRSSFFPVISYSGDYSRVRSSKNIEFKSNSGRTLNDYLVQADASWEPDLWGRVSRSVEGAKANAQASAADVQSALLSMQAELATDYFELRGIDREQQLLDDTIRAYKEAVELTQNRLNGGIATDADVAQAQTQLRTTQAQQIDLGVQRAQLEHAIAILAGQPPSTFSLPVAPLAAVPVVAPAGVPSGLLERRPDIASAERHIVDMNAQIGVATAAFFPQLVLSLTGGFEATNYSQWLMAPSRIWSLGPTLAGTLLDFGARSAQKDQAIANYDESVAQYRQTVLDAFGQVEDNLAALRVLENEAQAQDEAVSAAERSLAILTDRYKNGAITYLDVVVAQTTALNNEVQAVSIARRRMAASVALVKALGGGWDVSALPTDDQLVHPDADSKPDSRPASAPAAASS